MASEGSGLYEFGEYRLDSETLTLWQGESLVPLSPKALELLKLLIEHRGEIVSKQEIFDKVWADTFVEDGVLTQNVYTLRHTLGTAVDGKQYIENIARRGYRIGVPVHLRSAGNGEARTVGVDGTSPAQTIHPSYIAGTPRQASRTHNTRRVAGRDVLFVMLGLLLLSAAGVLGYIYLNRPERLIANVKFRKLTDTGDIFFPAISPNGRLLAYSRNTESAFIKDIDSGAETPLVLPESGEFGFLQFTADNGSICFRDRYAIFISADVECAPVTGGSPKGHAKNIWGNFSFSPDGRYMAFVRVHPGENRQAVTVKDLQSGAEKEIMTRNSPEEFYLRAFPAWSPDGRRLAVITHTSQTQFLKAVAVEIDSGREEDIATGDLKQVEQLAWLSEGDALVASGRTEKNFQLWRISHPAGEILPITNDLSSHRFLSLSSDGKRLVTMQVLYYSNIFAIGDGGEVQLTTGTSKNDGYFGIDWFGDGRIVYTSNEGPGNEWNLWIIDSAGGGDRRKLTGNAGSRNDWPTVSVDDRYIYFSSNRSGQFQIWRIAADGSDPVQITFAENEDHIYPQLSPDSAWLYFIRKQPRSSSVWRKSLLDGTEEKLTEEEKLSPSNFLSLSPDGKMLAFHNLTEPASREASATMYQIVLLPTDNPRAPVFTTISRSKLEVYWRPDSTSFEFVSFADEDGRIWKQPVEPASQPEQMAVFPKERLFFVDWSRDGKRFALSRGQQKHDAALVTNFE